MPVATRRKGKRFVKCNTLAVRNLRLISFGCDGSRGRRQQLRNRPIHRAIHLGYNRRHVTLGDLPDFGNFVGPNGFAGGELRHLGGDRNLDFDATFMIHFVQSLQASAEDVIDVRVSVVDLDLAETAARSQMVCDRSGDEFAGIDSPAMVVVRADLFW